jgi:hypothetical protein
VDNDRYTKIGALYWWHDLNGWYGHEYPRNQDPILADWWAGCRHPHPGWRWNAWRR